MSKRFWSEAMCSRSDQGYRILLDGKPLRLPSGAGLVLHNPKLAEAIAAEWHDAGGAKGGIFTPADVPLTGLAGSALERIVPQRAAMVATLARYAEADLLCYRAETPRDLAAEQQAGWQPWLDWAERRHGARLCVTTSIKHVPQPAGSLAALHAAVDARSVEELAALGLAIPALGSCVLGLALADTEISPEDALQVGCLDEFYQERLWGTDPDAVLRRAHLANDLALAHRFMELSRD